MSRSTVNKILQRFKPVTMGFHRGCHLHRRAHCTYLQDVAPVKQRQGIHRRSRRYISTTLQTSVEPSLDMDYLDRRLEDSGPITEISQQLQEKGYYTCHNFLNSEATAAMRLQSIALRDQGRFEQSWSESIGVDGVARRFNKPGVSACEPDGADYETAPDLLIYMSWLLQTLPPKLNSAMGTQSVELSSQAFNAKLAVTLPGGSTYPLHIDNPQQQQQSQATQDTRKLTAIIYLNPGYNRETDGGELRLHLNDNKVRDFPPDGGRLVLFWSDEIPHEVLPTSPNYKEDSDENNDGKEAGTKDRYALTVWIPTEGANQHVHSPTSKFANLKDVF